MDKPVLGILTLYLNEQKHLEERHIYQKMIVAGKKLGLTVFVFTPQDVDEQHKRINGMWYHPESKRWIRKWTRFPTMIFDRCRIQKSYRFEQLKRFRSKYPKLLYLNRPLRNKWTIYQVLSTVPSLKKYLPDTRLYSGIQDVQRMLKERPLLYLKPVNGTGGRGILRIQRIRSSDGVVYVEGRDHQRQVIRPQKMTYSQLASRLSSWKANDRYLIQQGIALKLPSGRVHDYRMLVQKNGSGVWSVTGCAGRVGPVNSITSNLHGGGQAVRMEELLSQWIGDKTRILHIRREAEALSLEVAAFLEKRYDALCELALDLAIDQKGRIWLLEVNPKPAREVFHRIGDKETYRKSIIRPLEYASWLYRKKAGIKLPDSGKATQPQEENKPAESNPADKKDA
ncbi:MAG: YheC/YheD family protein [Paenibacillus dendritiformis]|uniref:YheC/YheD family endospore coat-associated protein n=1 Tax=Paenibacillus dendritiformis TaxID=130049 RepID=UPI001B08E14B|nr:YheC/YheD family protein [Paenibacillus dendritiformis]MDU5143492.1 YheC/YheD family protein [Paenibacillus dendritiformis]GIO73278.1 endospore coat-associated protein YheC [Paenibacillus dendritiformis]